MVELALVIPLLLFVLFAIIDFGEALNQYNDTTNLANLGVRAAAIASSSGTNPTCTTGGVASANLVGYLDCEGALDANALGHLTVCAQDSTSTTWAQGDTIQLKVDDTFSWLKIMYGGIGKLGGAVSGPTTTISSSATMREEAVGNTTTPTWVAGTGTQTVATTLASC